MEPKVTIGLPFFNSEKSLSEAISSVLLQTYKNWELLLVDDGSTDNSLAIAKSFNDPRIRVFSDGKNLKLATRLNQISMLASGEFIARMDADDLMFPERIEYEMSVLSKNPNVDLVSTGVISVSKTLKYLGSRGQMVDSYSVSELLSREKAFLHAALLARKGWYQRNKYLESMRVSQDSELWVRAAARGDFNALSIPDRLYIYREDNNVSKNKQLNAQKMRRKFILKYEVKFLKRMRYYLMSYLKSLFIFFMPPSYVKSTLIRSRLESSNDSELEKRRLAEFLLEVKKTAAHFSNGRS